MPRSRKVLFCWSMPCQGVWCWFWIATALAGAVVFFELWAIAAIRARYMDTPFLRAALQIVLGGAIVLATGILIGGA